MTKPPDANDIAKNGGVDALRGAFDGARRAGTNGMPGAPTTPTSASSSHNARPTSRPSALYGFGQAAPRLGSRP